MLQAFNKIKTSKYTTKKFQLSYRLLLMNIYL